MTKNKRDVTPNQIIWFTSMYLKSPSIIAIINDDNTTNKKVKIKYNDFLFTLHAGILNLRLVIISLISFSINKNIKK